MINWSPEDWALVERAGELLQLVTAHEYGNRTITGGSFSIGGSWIDYHIEDGGNPYLTISSFPSGDNVEPVYSDTRKCRWLDIADYVKWLDEAVKVVKAAK